MAIGTITMILANVGLSIFNNWAGSRQNKQIAEKREEFERAAREGQRERMLQLMREGQQLTLELEEQKHKERLSELNDQFDNLIKELARKASKPKSTIQSAFCARNLRLFGRNCVILHWILVKTIALLGWNIVDIINL